ncbi:MAG: nucleotidyl transferase AbiEii/AbiGii toxin family protein [Verrucomicrobiota bacterium]
MALTTFQRSICRILAPSRKERESYVAGGLALNVLLDAPRLSEDIDLFHDTMEALAFTVGEDCRLLEAAGHAVEFVREAPAFAEANIGKDGESTTIQWVHDSAFRFFPLEENRELGVTMHSFDLATNKVMAMVGRVKPRDWIDVMSCCEKLQPLGFLVWAACGKDPGFNPVSLLQFIKRSTRYTQPELDELDFDGETPDAAELGACWHGHVWDAERIVERLPAEHVGECVLSAEGGLCQALPDDVSELRFHKGRIGGAMPTFPCGE